MRHSFLYVLFINVIINYDNTNSAPVNQSVNLKALSFMKKFGYLTEDDNSDALYTEEGLSEIIKQVQKFGAIPETGLIDNATVKLMSTPRCGVADVIRKKRYVIGSEGWKKRHLTYHIANWSGKLSEDIVTRYIQLALDTWGQYGRLTFEKTKSPSADIIVSFGRGHHGDRYPFDGPGLILAHAFFPYEYDYGGDIHFDDDEDWSDYNTAESTEGIDFYSVALHELGHSLGLGHSADSNSVMFPYYQMSGDNQLSLNYDDILGMYELYIRRHIDEEETTKTERDDERRSVAVTTDVSTITTETTISTTLGAELTTIFHTSGRNVDGSEKSTASFSTITTPFWQSTSTSDYPDLSSTTENSRWVDDDKTRTLGYSPETTNGRKEYDYDSVTEKSKKIPNICEGNFDAVAKLRGELFIFKGQYIWRLREKSRIEPGYPVLLQEMFIDLPQSITKVDAVYERPDGMIVIFIGNNYWVYDGSRFLENSPLPLSYYGLPDYLDSIDAVQIWERNKKTYIYKENLFWRYNETTKEMDPGYPRDIGIWRGVPERLDAAVTWKDGYTYFFKNDLFWKFDNTWVSINENYPLPAPQIWLGCKENVHTMSQTLPD